VKETLEGREDEEEDDLKETRRYRNLKDDAVYRTVWRPRFGRGHGSVASHTT
jgi:hypothetical protein